MSPTAHARLGPSAAKIWMSCPGAPRMQDPIANRTSEHAERGTAAHEALELILQGKVVDNPMSNGVDLDDADFDAIKVAVDYLNDEVEDGDEWELETRLKFNDDLWGTSDFSRYRPSTRELLVVDYKHGAGVPVDAENNPQGLIYAIMKLKSLGNRGIDKIRFVIIQPRCHHPDGPIREWEIDPVDTLMYEAEIIDAIQNVQEADVSYDAMHLEDFAEMYLSRGDHCRWCRANFAGGCPLVQKDLDAAAEMDFSPGYQPKDLADALAVADRAEAAIKATRAFAYAEADRGVVIPGWKLVNKRASERWTDTDAATSALRKNGVGLGEMFEPSKLKTPAKVRDALAAHMAGSTKKERTENARRWLGDFIEKVSSGTTLAPEDDKRPAAKSDPTADFDPLA